MPIGVVKFAEFELDRGRYELRRGDSVLKLEKIPMELLVLLVESNGQLLSRDEIVERIWGKDVFLDTEHGINTAIRKIRQTLGDDPENPRFVQTVTGKGYRFIATTNTVPANGNGNSVIRATASDARASTRPSELDGGTRAIEGGAPAIGPKARAGRGRRFAGLAFMASIGIAAVIFGLNVLGVRDRIFPASSGTRIHSLAVLPLENLSADPAQEYFADGMTDELITMLAKNTELRVVSRTSVMQYKKVHRPLAEVARELGVDGILEGSVARSGNRVHINTQLIYAPTDTHIWAESYDRDLGELGSLQSDLARSVARQVGLSTSVPSAISTRRIDPAAHDAYLLGRYYWFAEQYEKSKEYFDKAIAIDPGYAAAWAGLADYYIAKAASEEGPPESLIPPGEAAARKAVALDDSSPEAHHSLAAAYYFGRWDWAAAEREITRSIELDPHRAEAHHLHSYILGTLGRTDEALREQRTATEIDPFARPWAMGYALIRAHQFDAAISELRSRSQAQPNDVVVMDLLSHALFFGGHEKEAAVEREQTLLRIGAKEEAAAEHAAFLQGGLTAMAERHLNNLKKGAARGYVSPARLAAWSARLHRKDETLAYLERAYNEHATQMVRLPDEPEYDFLRTDPRFQAILQKMGLPITPKT